MCAESTSSVMPKILILESSYAPFNCIFSMWVVTFKMFPNHVFIIFC